MTKETMKIPRIFVPSYGPADWRARLADPLLHWKRKKSAWELAVSWESQRETVSGLPPEIENALNAHPFFASARLILAIPEHKVPLDGNRRPSQNDLWALIAVTTGLVSVTIEGKAGEEFDKTIDEWLKKESEGKRERLAFLTSTLGLKETPGDHIRYQLLHRTASALIEAKRWSLQTALMLVQSFSESDSSWSDYGNFAQLLGITPQRGVVGGPWNVGGINLFTAWIDSPCASDAVAANAT
jgi:hypothetical protein